MKQMALYRIVRIVSMSIVFFTEITLFQRRYRGRFTPNVQRKWDCLVTKQAKNYKVLALELGGLMIKLGQFLSTRADIMPSSFIAELEGLTDHVTAVPKKQALALLHEEVGGLFENKTISQISAEPVASASIGEVYKGRLNNGTDVAIKVQRPNIERILRADFQAVKIVIWLAKQFTSFGKQVDLDLLYTEMTDTIGGELNFLQELKNGQDFAKRFGDMPGVRFPFYYEQYSTRRVLIMEWIEGSKITDIAFLEEHGIDRREMAERLSHLFVRQTLEGGLFHADPHGGNLLVQPDGTLVLIDFGMIVSISKEDAQSMFIVVEGILFKQYDRVLDGLEQLHFLLPHADRKVLAKAIEKVVKAYESNELTNMNSFAADQLLADLKEIVRTQPVQLPAEFAFLGRAISVFVGVLHILNPHVDLLNISKPQIIEWAGKRTAGSNSFSKKDAQRIVLETIGQLRSFPKQLTSFLEEPARMRETQEKHFAIRANERIRLQTRQFAGLTASISLSFAFVGLWQEHALLLLTAGAIFILSSLVFWRRTR